MSKTQTNEERRRNIAYTRAESEKTVRDFLRNTTALDYPAGARYLIRSKAK